MDPLDDPLTTRPIQVSWEICIELYLKRRFRWIYNPDRQFGYSLGWTQTLTWSNGPEPLLSLLKTHGWMSWYTDNQVETISIVEWFVSEYPQHLRNIQIYRESARATISGMKFGWYWSGVKIIVFIYRDGKRRLPVSKINQEENLPWCRIYTMSRELS